MVLTVTVIREGDKCEFYVDDYINDKFANTATGLKFARRALFTQDAGKPAFDLPLEDAKEMAREILKLGGD